MSNNNKQYLNFQELYPDCPPDKAFWTIKGDIIRNIHELYTVISLMDDWTFRYHVNIDNNKNDFADWIRDVLGGDDLAFKLEGIIDQNKYIKILKETIKN